MTNTTLTKPIIKGMIKIRERGSHKGDNGSVLVIGGSRDYYGAPILVASAAIRSWVDLICVLVPNYIYTATATYLPDLIIRSYEGDLLNNKSIDLINEFKDKMDVLNIGNGLTKKPSVLETAKKIVDNWGKPIVIDADCLVPPILKHITDKTILTPHTGEFKRLFNVELPKNPEKRSGLVEKIAREYGCVILSKGIIDIISDGNKTYQNETGNAGMTVGGTGDTLAGITGAFAAQTHNLLESACIAAYVNGYAGDLAFKELGYSLLASDLINKIPRALSDIIKK